MPLIQKIHKRLTGKDWVFSLPLVIIVPSWALYFCIFFGSSADLQQMRRILLAGLIVPLSILTLAFIIGKYLKSGLLVSPRNKWLSIVSVITAIAMLSTMVTFHARLSDAFRHAYASAFLTYYTNPETARQLGNLVEWMTSYKKYNLFNTSMDQCNNHTGRQIAVTAKERQESWQDVESRIERAYKNSGLILSKHQYNDIIACYKNIFPGETAAISAMQRYLTFGSQKK
jgi:hypothetical protein